MRARFPARDIYILQQQQQIRTCRRRLLQHIIPCRRCPSPSHMRMRFPARDICTLQQQQQSRNCRRRLLQRISSVSSSLSVAVADASALSCARYLYIAAATAEHGRTCRRRLLQRISRRVVVVRR